MRHFLCLICLFITVNGICQAPQWNLPVKVGGNKSEELKKQVIGKTGRYVFITSQSNSFQVGSQAISGVSAGGSSFFTCMLVKFSETNQILWIIKNSTGNSFNDFQIDEQDHVFVFLNVLNNSTFMGRTFLYDTQTTNNYLIRIRPDGQLQSVKSNFPSFSYSTQINDGIFFLYRNKSLGNQVVNGVSLSDSVHYILKMDTVANILTLKNIGKIETSLGNKNPLLFNGERLYFTGNYGLNDMRYNPDVWNLPVPDSLDIRLFIACFDNDLQFLRVTTSRGKPNLLLGFYSSVYAGALSDDGNKGLYIAGQCSSLDSISFDSVLLLNNPAPQPGQQEINVFLLHINSEGRVMEGRVFGTNREDIVTGISIDSIRTILLSGYSAAGIELDGFGTPASEGGMWLAKFNNHLKVKWLKEVKGLFRSFVAIDTDKKGNGFGAGSWSGYFNPSQTPPILLDSAALTLSASAPGWANQRDSFLARLGNCNLANPILSGPPNQSFCQSDSLILTCSSFQKYQWNTGDSTQNISIKKPGAYHCYIYDSLGCYARSQTIVVNEIPVRTSSLSVSLCTNQSFLGYDTSGIYIDTLVSSLGCDSIRTLTLNYNIPNNSIQLSAEFGALAAPNQDSYQWLDCNAGFAPLPGETDSSFAPTVSGSYAVKVTKGSCADTSSCLFLVSTEPKIVAKSGLNIFPNPAQGFTTIDCPSCKEGQTIEIFSTDGSRIKTLNISPDKRLTVEGLPAGVFTVRVKGHHFIPEKLVIW
jgi:hypothetical protein